MKKRPIDLPLLRRARWLIERTEIACEPLSILAGLSSATLGHIAYGRADRPSLPTLRALAAITDAPLSWLVLGEGLAPDAGVIRSAIARAQRLALTRGVAA